MSDQVLVETMFGIDFQRMVLKFYGQNMQFAANYGMHLEEEYFENQSLRILVTLVKEYVLGYETELDLSVVMTKIDDYSSSHGLTTDMAKELVQEARAVFASHIKSESFIVDQLLKFIRRQKLRNALYQSVEILEKNDGYDKVLSLIDGAVSVGAGADEGLEFNDLLNISALYKEKYDHKLLVTTGIPAYDKALHGGMAPGEVHVIQAPPKTGKSTWGTCTGSAALRQQYKLGYTDRGVFHITLEIGKEDVAMKYAMNLARMDQSEICGHDDRMFAHKMKRYEKHKPNLFINYWTEGTINALTIRSWISRIRSKTGISPWLIVVDYDDLMLPIGGSTESGYDDAGTVYGDFKGLADYFKCPLLTFAQPQREAWSFPNEGKVIEHYQLAHSAKKAHKCFSVSSLNFPDNSNNGILWVDLVRRGESKVKVKITKDLKHALFYESGTRPPALKK